MPPLEDAFRHDLDEAIHHSLESDSATTRPRFRPAWELAASNRSRWLHCYGTCLPFLARLKQLYSDFFEPVANCVRQIWLTPQYGGFARLEDCKTASHSGLQQPHEVAAYRTEVRKVCEDWGLDRLYPVEVATAAILAKAKTKKRLSAFDMRQLCKNSKPDGAEAVHQWCLDRSKLGFFPGIPVRNYTGPWPTLPTAPDLASPSVGAHVSTPYHPARDNRTAVKRRLWQEFSSQIDRQLDEIDRAAEVAGFFAESKQSAVDLHITWLFLDIAIGCTHPEIADIQKHSNRLISLFGGELASEILLSHQYDRKRTRRNPITREDRTISRAVWDIAPEIGICLR
ncbi:MAG: hypothetical protein M3Q29_25380 [Chloroflexota bacterium]|nr:hypothetical protein [Chloroflexota bacterium]